MEIELVLRRGYFGPSLHGSNALDQKGIETKADFRQASHTIQKMNASEYGENRLGARFGLLRARIGHLNMGSLHKFYQGLRVD